MQIRLENPNDCREVENLTREAFWNVYRPGCSEHLILHELRGDPCFVPELNYVLEENGQIIAHIAYAKGKLVLDSGGETELLLFEPVSVLPAYQNKGYGGKLIRFTLGRAKALGCPAVVITGSPEYYSRFGFVPASAHSVYYNGLDKNEDFPYFMIKILDEEKAKRLKGTYFDPPCYFADDAAVEEFDKAFPPKVKEVRAGQLP